MYPIGRFVRYRNAKTEFHNVGLVVAQHGTQSKVLFLDNTKLMVNNTNLIPTDKMCTQVYYDGATYLVSNKGTIISLVTCRIMQWPENHGVRKHILELAEAVRNN